MNNLKDIHNEWKCFLLFWLVVLSGFQWTIWRIYTTIWKLCEKLSRLFYQDFNEQFEGYTQPYASAYDNGNCCFIRISMNNLKDIHNYITVLIFLGMLFYQDFNEQFEGYTQRGGCAPRSQYVVLSGFQWTIWRIYTTLAVRWSIIRTLFYQDFNEQFEGYTQQNATAQAKQKSCFIRISMNNLKDIHNLGVALLLFSVVVLSGFQWTIWRIYTTFRIFFFIIIKLFYQDFNEQFCCKSTKNPWNLQIYWKIFWYFRKK